MLPYSNPYRKDPEEAWIFFFVRRFLLESLSWGTPRRQHMLYPVGKIK